MTLDQIKASYPRERNEQIDARRAKLKALKDNGMATFKHGVERDTTAAQFAQRYAGQSREELAASEVEHSMAGRIKAVRMFGKAAFFQLEDGSGRYQAFLAKDELGDDFQFCKELLEVGDIIFLRGTAMKTKTDELTVRAKQVVLLTKSIRPLPEKFHGLSDVEMRYRQRYLDLMVTEKTRRTFLLRSRMMQVIRAFFDRHCFMEVETPMLHPIAGGAVARPFKTHHNTLSMDMFLRIAPELYLKRLLVGGFERVFEINRSFRNEGISIRHNPEFTMLEFYAAYSTYEKLMVLIEELCSSLCAELELDAKNFVYGKETISLMPPFARLTMREAVVQHTDLTNEDLGDAAKLHTWLRGRGIEVNKRIAASAGHMLVEVFDNFVEDKLRHPTFITAYPVEVSPLARRNDEDGSVVDRFELIVCGRETANGFNELNDYDDQYERFCQQNLQRLAGDEEACEVDLDYVRALEYGMPPTAGAGIGIDRLMMLFTDNPSIRDVILFPQLRGKE